MALIDVVQFNPDQNLDWVMYRYPGNEFHTRSKLIVGPGQRAIAVHGGKVEGEFKSGTSILSTEVYPFIQPWVRKVHGGKVPFTMEIYFFNTTIRTNLDWGTKKPALVQDPQTGLMVHVRAYGSYMVRLGDTQFFLTQFMGAIADNNCVTWSYVAAQLDGIVQESVQEGLGALLVEGKTNVLALPTKARDFSEYMLKTIYNFFAKYGFEITDFTTMSINVPDEDMEAFKKRAEYAVLGTSYERNRQLDIQEQWAKNEGTGGSVAAAGMGLGIGLAGLGQFGQNPPPVAGGASSMNPAGQTEATATCPKCSKPIPKDAKFCPECGANLHPVCPKCGHAVDVNAKFCPECGTKLGE